LGDKHFNNAEIFKCEKILKTSDFSAVYKSKEKYFTKNFFLTVGGGEKRKIGITVSSKVGKANIKTALKG